MRQPKILVLFEDTTTCGNGHAGAHRTVIRTTVNDAGDVTVIQCFECDRLECPKCKRRIPGDLMRCPCGAPLPQAQ